YDLNAGPHTLSTAAKLQPLRPPVSWASAHYRLCRCNHKACAWKMHANLADLAITASDHDLMDVRGDQFTDNRIASSIAEPSSAAHSRKAMPRFIVAAAHPSGFVSRVKTERAPSKATIARSRFSHQWPA